MVYKLYQTHKKGFTLIDVLLTVAIISLLSSLSLFRFTEAKKSAEDKKMQVEAHQVSNAVALYRVDNNGRAPIVGAGGAEGTRNKIHAENDPASDYVPTMQMLVNQGYLSEVPTSPSGEGYMYAVTEYDEAVFGARLNNEYSNNNRNYCSFDSSDDSSENIIYYEGEGCTFVTPPRVCTTDEFGYRTCVQDPGSLVCPPQTTPLCDGSSNADYCQCM